MHVDYLFNDLSALKILIIVLNCLSASSSVRLSGSRIPWGVILTMLIFLLCTYIGWEKLDIVRRTVVPGTRRFML